VIVFVPRYQVGQQLTICCLIPWTTSLK